MTRVEVPTPHGPARAELHSAEEGHAALLLGHGAGGVDSPDLVAATRAATTSGVHVALVEQPYRVAGRPLPPSAKQLDAAWLAVAADLSHRWFAELPLLFGGRSSGARVACRTAAAGQTVAVLCLAFPVHPPAKPHEDRMGELDELAVPALVVQGDRDPFGRPEQSHHREVAIVPGDHALAADVDGVFRVVHEWLERTLRPLST